LRGKFLFSSKQGEVAQCWSWSSLELHGRPSHIRRKNPIKEINGDKKNPRRGTPVFTRTLLASEGSHNDKEEKEVKKKFRRNHPP